jgi:hypothetical protein
VSDFRCAELSAELGERVWATASRVHKWLLIEQSGAWGRDAVLESRLPRPVARELMQRAGRHNVRILLIRRPDRSSAPRRECFVGYSGRPTPWLERLRVDDPEELLGIDLGAMEAGRPLGAGEPWDQPLYLVCTNGRHDPCCAQWGRPVVRALLAARRYSVWECSHMGGERFAGNLLCLPHGLYYGRLGAASATAVAGDYEAGRLRLDHFRGRAGDPFVVQAAEHFLRQELRLFGIDDVMPTHRRRLEPGLVQVGFLLEDLRQFEVVVQVLPGEARPLTCTAPSPQQPPSYRLNAVFPRPPGAAAIH